VPREPGVPSVTGRVRWGAWRAVPRVGDADFTVAGLVDTANRDLANGVGNLVNRVASLTHRLRGGVLPPATLTASAVNHLAARIDCALARFDFRTALDAISQTVA